MDMLEGFLKRLRPCQKEGAWFVVVRWGQGRK